MRTVAAWSKMNQKRQPAPHPVIVFPDTLCYNSDILRKGDNPRQILKRGEERP